MTRKQFVHINTKLNITRRDFVNSMLMGAGTALCSSQAPLLRQALAATSGTLPPPDLGPAWYGYGGVGDYAESHGNTPEAVFRAHAIRDGKFPAGDAPVLDTKEVYELVIVGGGMAGLGAALRFKQKRPSGGTALLVDNHPVFGGESKRNEIIVDGHRLIAPQGANGFSVPNLDGGKYAEGDARYFQELDIPRQFSYPAWPPELTPLKFGQDDYGFLYWHEDAVTVGYFFDEISHGVGGKWVKEPWQNSLNGFPISAEIRDDLIKWRNWRHKPYNGDDFATWLDGMTYKDFIVKVLGLRPEVAAYADPILASAAGGCSDVLSAYSAYAIGMPGVATFYDKFELGERHSFPGGNDGFARMFVKAILPGAIEGGNSFNEIINGQVRFDRLDRSGAPIRMRLNATVIAVEHERTSTDSDYVLVTYVKDRRLHRVKARNVVMATGSWVTKYVVKDLPAAHRKAYESFVHSSFLVANVALKNWRFLYDLGITGFRWWGDLGFAANLKRPMHVGGYQPPFHPDLPAVLSLYIPFFFPGRTATEQGILGRTELLQTSFAEYESKIRRLMHRLFGKYGFKHEEQIAGIILNRWGHAFLIPQPGFYMGSNGAPPPSEVIRARHGRIAFGHSELRGNQHWGPAAAEGSRAVDQLLV